jgi:hypothetical protein
MHLSNPIQHFSQQGFTLLTGAVPAASLANIRHELLQVSKHLGVPKETENVDAAWNCFKQNNRRKGSLLYNAFKRLPSVHRLATDPHLISAIQLATGYEMPALIDVNCRIDSAGEDEYLFDWHQDYWFSVSSTNAVVVWIPLERIDEGTGGIELLSLETSGTRVFKTTPGSNYNSYADAVKLAEKLPAGPVIGAPMEPGDALVFKFNILHRSKPVLAKDRSRFTMQLRFVDLTDPQFIANDYKPGTVSNANIDYLNQEN